MDIASVAPEEPQSAVGRGEGAMGVDVPEGRAQPSRDLFSVPPVQPLIAPIVMPLMK